MACSIFLGWPMPTSLRISYVVHAKSAKQVIWRVIKARKDDKTYDASLPKGNKLPATTYDGKQVVCPLGLEVQKIHACPNDCILYRGEEYENLKACQVCKALQYKIKRDDPVMLTDSLRRREFLLR